MQRHKGESGAALILLIGITAALAILAAAAVMVLANQQGATATDRSDKTSMDYAEAGLDSAVSAVKAHTFSTTTAFVTGDEMAANYYAAFPQGPALTTRVYDDQATVNTAILWDQGGPTAPTTPDNKVWVEVQVTYQGQTTRLRQMVSQTTSQSVTSFPQAAMFSDGNITTSGGGDLYAVNPDGTTDLDGMPYQTDIMTGGNFTSSSQTDLAAPGTTTQTLGIQANGTVSTTGHVFSDVQSPPTPRVPLLSDYFNQAAQAALQFEAQACVRDATVQAKFNGTVTALTSAQVTALQSTANQTYNAGGDVKVSGNLTLDNNVSSGASTFNFRSLYVTGNLTLNSTRGNITVNATSVYVGGTFTINGPDGPQKLGPIYVGVDASWTGGTTANPLSVQTTNYLDASQEPGPVYVGGTGSGLFSCGGVYNHILGPMWIVGHPATGDPAVTFAATSSSSVMCPLMATTEKIVTSGPVTFGSLTRPMILYMVCDNDNLYTNQMDWGSTGTYYGLMVVMEADVVLDGGNTFNGLPNIVGALFCSRNVSVTNNTSLCYNQTVLDNVTQASITQITTTRTTVPGTWQELSPN